MYAQDNDEMLPTAATVWGKLDLPPKIYQCPTVKLTQSYAYSPRCDAMALGDLPNPSATWVTADGDAEGFDLRHNGKPVSSYLDGHAELSYPYVVFTPINANAPCYTPYLVGHTIDGSGLSAPVNSGDAMSANSWPTHTATANPASSPYPLTSDSTYFQQTNPFSDIVYDLGIASRLKGFHLWNYNETGSGLTSRGIKTAIINVSTDGANWTTVGPNPATFAKAPAAAYAGEDYTFSTLPLARYVKISPTANWYTTTVYAVGLCEIRFLGVDAFSSTAAGYIVKPVSGTQTVGTSYSGRPPAKAIDGSGLSAACDTGTKVLPPYSWPMHDTLGANEWLSTGNAGKEVVFDLGKSCELTACHIWNNSSVINRGVKNFTVAVSPDNSAWTPVT